MIALRLRHRLALSLSVTLLCIVALAAYKVARVDPVRDCHHGWLCRPATALCAYRASAFLDQLSAAVSEWEEIQTSVTDAMDVSIRDEITVVQVAARITVPSHVARLQEVRRRTANLQPPGCAAKIQTSVTDAMDVSIRKMLDFANSGYFGTLGAQYAKMTRVMITIPWLLPGVELHYLYDCLDNCSAQVARVVDRLGNPDGHR